MKKDVLIKFRCSHLEKAIIEQKANDSGRSVSSYARSTALNKHIGYKLTDAELETLYLLKDYKNNFERIKNLIVNKDHQLWQEVESTSQAISTILKKFE